ncbi:MAG: radical SAM family heme chaperone HemW [Bacteroidia bacterium]|nr:radical SAM family heme chaperone HemW [Bacteroidia bacterium]
MAGIYIHIPFCKTRCVYCDFYKETDESQINAFVSALCKEIQLRKNEVSESVKSVYLGGGTPSRLSKQHLEQIFETLNTEFSIDNNAEITLEANPDDLSPEYIQILSQSPLNRISIGIQSFEDDELKFLSRRHSSQQAIDAVKNCQQAGFHNISIDLIYGLPRQTLEIWEKNLKKACELNIQHISAYHLIYEEKTKLYSLLQKGRVQPVNDDTSTEMFSMLINMLTKNGFEHYEISNFAKNGLYSKHNTSYWQNERYIGLAPSAHSYDGENRSWNIASIKKYITSVQSGKLLQETEHLTLSKKYNEFILTGLRTMWGVDLQQLKSIFGEKYYDFCIKNAQKYINKRLLTIKNNSLILTREGIFISDGIMSELMFID